MSELPEPETFGDYANWPGRDVVDASGERLGEVQEIYLDDATDRPEWVLVKTSDGSRFVPLARGKVDGETIRVAHAATAVASAPALEPSKELTQAEERELYDHYSVAVSEAASETLVPEPEQPAPEPEPAAAEPEPEPEPAAAEPEPEPQPEPQPEPEPEPAPEPAPEPEPAPAPEPPKAAAPPPPRPPPPAPASSGPPPAAIAGAIAALILLLIIIRRRGE
jgi:outer membrane biosynthesis protein TonB